MIQVSCNSLKKYYGAELILHDVSFEVNEGERVALVGPNGCGKSTVLKIISKIEGCEEGSVAIRKDTVVGYLEQSPVYEKGMTVNEVLQLAFPEINQCKEQLEILELKLADAGDEMEEVLKKYSDCSERYEHLGGYALEERYSKIYQGLQLKEDMLKKEFATLSGGEKTIVCLAKVLLMNPDVLILDEPTNHLDMSMLSWLENYLLSYKGSVIFVSHDRYFLKNVTTRVVDMECGTSKVFPYPYERYVEEKQKLREEQEANYKEQQKQIKKLEQAIKRLRIWAAQGDNEKMFHQAASMQKRLDKMDKVEKPTQMNYQAQIDFGKAERSGKDVLQVEHLSKAFGTKTLLKDAELDIYYQEHIAMIGPNGCGKSTFIKMMLGEEPYDAGNIKIGASLKIAYLPQNVQFSHEDWTVLETFREDLNLAEGKARELLAKYLFTKETVFKQVKNLSGGERSRLKFAMLLQTEINFLILDEPTNHLDIPSRERLEEALLQFHGTILMISHDRYFINRLATRVVEFTEGTFQSYAGGFDDYLVEKEKRKAVGREISQMVVEKKSAEMEDRKQSKVESRNNQESGQEKKPSKYTLQIKIEKLEQEIEADEKHQKELQQEIELAAIDYIRLSELQHELRSLEQRLEENYSEWTRLSSCLDE